MSKYHVNEFFSTNSTNFSQNKTSSNAILFRVNKIFIKIYSSFD